MEDAERLNQPVSEVLETEKESYKDVPKPVYKFFKANIGTIKSQEIKKLQKISKWAFDDDTDLEEGIKKIRELEIKLGSPSKGETRWDRMYNFVQIAKDIQELKKKQKALI